MSSRGSAATKFCVLAIQAAPAAVDAVRDHLAGALDVARIAATVGAAALSDEVSLDAARKNADRRMLARKAAGRSAQPM